MSDGTLLRCKTLAALSHHVPGSELDKITPVGLVNANPHLLPQLFHVAPVNRLTDFQPGQRFCDHFAF